MLIIDNYNRVLYVYNLSPPGLDFPVPNYYSGPDYNSLISFINRLLQACKIIAAFNNTTIISTSNISNISNIRYSVQKFHEENKAAAEQD